MNRRGFLRFLGLVPLGLAAGTASAMSEPMDIDRLTVKVDVDREGVIRAAVQESREAALRNLSADFRHMQARSL